MLVDVMERAKKIWSELQIVQCGELVGPIFRYSYAFCDFESLLLFIRYQSFFILQVYLDIFKTVS